MAICASYFSLMRFMRIRLQVFCPCGHCLITLVALEAGRHFRDLLRALVPMAISAGQPQFAVSVFNLVLMLGVNSDCEGQKGNHPKDHNQYFFSFHFVSPTPRLWKRSCRQPIRMYAPSRKRIQTDMCLRERRPQLLLLHKDL